MTPPDDPAAAAAARIGDILATAEREVAQIVAAAERRASSDEQARAAALDDRATQLDRREADLDARERELDVRQRDLDVRAAEVAGRNAELTEITAELLTGALAAQVQARRLSDLLPLDAPDPAAPEPAEPPRMSSWRSARPSSVRRHDDDDRSDAPPRARGGRRAYGTHPADAPVGDDAPRPSTPAALRIVGPAEAGGTTGAGAADAGAAGRIDEAARTEEAEADARAVEDDLLDADPGDGAVADADAGAGGDAFVAAAREGEAYGAEGPGGRDVVAGPGRTRADGRPDAVPTDLGALPDATSGGEAERDALDGGGPGRDRGDSHDGGGSDGDPGDASAVRGTTDAGATDLGGRPSAGPVDDDAHSARTRDADVTADVGAERADVGDEGAASTEATTGPDPGDGPEWRDVLGSDDPPAGERPKWRDVLLPRRSGQDDAASPEVDAEPDDGDGEPADHPDKVDSARLVALSMAAEGRSREDVEAIVRDKLGIRDHEALLDYVFGISAPSSIVPSWPPRRRRRPS